MIEQALRHDGPALVEAIVSRQEHSMPPTITIDQIKGFGLFMIKAFSMDAGMKSSTSPRPTWCAEGDASRRIKQRRISRWAEVYRAEVGGPIKVQ
jgi:hypothetical protein